MNTNSINELGASRQPMPVGPSKAGQPPAPRATAGAASDSVEFSDDARKLAHAAGQSAPAREELIAAARRKLLSGQLSGPAVYDKTAEKLLRSGDLDQVNGNADDSDKIA